MTKSIRVDASAAVLPRVVITGIGLWTPLGCDRESTWQGLVQGRSASQWLSPPYWIGSTGVSGKALADSSFMRVEPAASALPLTGALGPAMRLAGAPCELPPECQTHGIDPVVALARRCSAEAIQDAGLADELLARETTGVVFGTSKGGLHTASRLISGDCEINPCDWWNVWPNAAARSVAAAMDCRGPVIAPVAACATGLAACIRGCDLIREGRCQIVVAGSSDASLQPAILGSFQRLGVLAREQHDAAKACRPFDRDRSGFVVGEGAGCLILESYEHAVARGARWYAEWLGGRMLADPVGLTQLDPLGTSLKRLLQDLLNVAPGHPDYINLHGTATVPNDQVESAATCSVLGKRADHVACSSLKGGLGHLLGAAGSVELAATVLAIRDQVVPPTVNLFTPDPALDLDFTPRQCKARSIERAWKLSLGFGGHLSAACVGRLRGVGDRTAKVDKTK